MEIHVTRKLRKATTPWERKLWQILRNHNLKGAKFRRQFKVGNYIVDFCCLTVKLIIELNGGHHLEEENRRSDKIRQEFLERQGYTVLRFWNNDIDNNLKGVVEVILQHL